MKVKKGDRVTVEYSVRLGDGRVVEETKEGKTLEFRVGEGDVLPGFEDQIIGMSVDENKSFTLKAKEAYGARRPELRLAYARMLVPGGVEPSKGDVFKVNVGSGEKIPARVVSVSDKVVVLDANHPLAGQDLTFEVRVVGIDNGT